MSKFIRPTKKDLQEFLLILPRDPRLRRLGRHSGPALTPTHHDRS